ncbi:uncharacterized protein LOC130799802 isoform X1 [Amaranthus tricolor]|uniref:uncharacterized protein LOC130799802 isoform X1 n=1 Tax=Amaranthus tricolor TaxID=29722 RepID=UPI002585FC33|nr:uncharacterized protein LOC130799802 isoform X1 [Amaranthus tricolor]
MEEEESDQLPNTFNDWESLPSSTHSHNQSTLQTHHYNNHNNDHNLSIFPPINHEGLPVPSLPLHAPPSFSIPNSKSNSLTSSSSSLPKPCDVSPFSTWFNFALHFWNSKLTRLRSRGAFSFIFPVATTVSFLGFLWFWIRWRRRVCSSTGKESIDRLKVLIKEKDEKIIQLLEQVAQMNKLLLARYRIPVLRSC